MNILYIWDADYPWDVRVEKICNSLYNAGHAVHIVARNLKKLPEHEITNGVHVHRMKAIQNDFMNYAATFPFFLSPKWSGLIHKVIEIQHIDLIIVRDLPMAAAGVWAGEKYKLPVIFDMAEDYCAMLREIWEKRKYKGFNLVVRNPYFAKWIEKYVINKFDHIFVVVEEAKDLVKKMGVKAEKISVIGNTPVLRDLRFSESADPPDIDNLKARYSVIYSGGITPDRGLSVVIDAIPHVISKIKDFLFVIVGKGFEIENLKRQVGKNGLEAYVKWVGWVQHDLLYEYIKASKIGIIPHYVTDHINTTIPNKIYDYMACGIPIIASDAVPMKRILSEERCGKAFKSGNAKSLAEALITIHRDPGRLGECGKAAILKKYNWEKDAEAMIDVLKSIGEKQMRLTEGQHG
jgi:glycosyltransferase involved in cell wall biosynthesis